MHRESLLGAPEQVYLHSNGEERMTCRDSLGYTEARKKRGESKLRRGCSCSRSQERERLIRVHMGILNPNSCLSHSVCICLDLNQQHLWSGLPVGHLSAHQT